MRRRPKGVPFIVPQEIARLPFNLKRTALYPRNPQLTAEAIMQFQRNMAGDALPAYMPQRMAFQMWKTYNGEPRPWWVSARSWHDMASQFTHGVPSRLVHKLPAPSTNPISRAAEGRGGRALPQPIVAALPETPRGVRTDSATSRFYGRAAPPAAAVAEQFAALGARGAFSRAQTKQDALAEARSAALRRRRLLK